MKKIANALVNITIALFAAIFIIMIAGPCYGWGTHPILSPSMEPALKVGGVIVVKPEKIENINKGDIITFNSARGLITHRVEEVHDIEGEVWFQTKGDNNNHPDENLVSSKKGVMRKVILFTPYVGYATKIFQNKVVFGLLMALLGSCLVINIALELKECIRIEKKKKEEEEDEKKDYFPDGSFDFGHRLDRCGKPVVLRRRRRRKR